MTDGFPAFEVALCCTNCGDEWSKEFPARTEVLSHYDRVYYVNTDHDSSPTKCERGCCGILQCPTCELKDHVDVDDREPFGGDDGG